MYAASIMQNNNNTLDADMLAQLLGASPGSTFPPNEAPASAEGPLMDLLGGLLVTALTPMIKEAIDADPEGAATRFTQLIIDTGTELANLDAENAKLKEMLQRAEDDRKNQRTCRCSGLSRGI
ncbi:hypothetical protein GS982_01170 [Rhodococcus hoagii]|uniref:Uncharacterized protein n=1 Tax=Rhodococcus hoagii TaxID=43767 RepID=A0A9Q4ZIJ3_RHOHA|nr:hypothetical protein [Prescottella equi]NKT77218.1 hypothetical protein [Prescottella equi]NKZ81002.1 hypothetical protein [Prescottella equi]